MSEASLLARLRTTPQVYDAGADEKVEELLALAAAEHGCAQLGQLVAAEPILRALLEGIASGSPYLWALIRENPPRFLKLLQTSPEQRLPQIMAETAAACRGSDIDTVMRALRRMKAEAALLIALTDLGSVWPLLDITRGITRIAEHAVRLALEHALADAVERGRLKCADPTNPGADCGLFILAMGKMGAYELNYSSDIDLIVFFDPEAGRLADSVEPHSFYVRVTRTLVKLLQERTADGYVFRTDLRLRPDPASTQIAMPIESAYGYYESIGQTWERAAYIKARVCAGDAVIGERFLKEMAPFVWRKYLDYAAVAEVHAMKRQIHAYKGHGEIAVAGHNVKIGRGGIREIEFFAQTQQLIAGGRDPRLRPRDTRSTLAALTEAKWITAQAEAELWEAYEFLRTVEHRIQMVADEQTQSLPEDDEALERISRFAGYETLGAFAIALTQRLRCVQEHYATLFEDAPPLAKVHGALNFPPNKDDRETLDTLFHMGFTDPVEASAVVRQWLAGARKGTRTEAARQALVELLPALFDRLAQTGEADAALRAFDRFLAGTARGVGLLAMLRHNPDLVQLIAGMLGTAPRLAGIISHDPSVLDGLLDPAFFGELPETAVVEARMHLALDASRDYEDFLDRSRAFGHEQVVLVGMRILSGTVSAARVGEAFAGLAEMLIRAVHRAVDRHFAAIHGHVAQGETAVIAMGKLGGREMTAASDLDLVVLYDFDAENPESDGERSLYGAQYFARFTQRLIAALTAETNLGRLYEVDMRLRPSGRKGPVATHVEGFIDYQATEAWTWEHMALTRARVISASPAFTQRCEAAIREVLVRRRDPRLVARDVLDMRKAIAEEHAEGDRWDLKYAAGGLVDVEFLSQWLQLVHAHDMPGILDTHTGRVLAKARQFGLLDENDGEALQRAYRLYHDLTQILRLCLTERFEASKASHDLVRLLTRAADTPDLPALEALLAETQGQVREIFTRLLEAACRDPKDATGAFATGTTLRKRKRSKP